jgi:hypothetical protein
VCALVPAMSHQLKLLMAGENRCSVTTRDVGLTWLHSRLAERQRKGGEAGKTRPIRLVEGLAWCAHTPSAFLPSMLRSPQAE